MIKLRCFSLLALCVSSTLGATTSTDVQKQLTPQERFEQQYLPSPRQNTVLQSNSVQQLRSNTSAQSALNLQTAATAPEVNAPEPGQFLVYVPDHQGRLVPEVLTDATTYAFAGKALQAVPSRQVGVVSPDKAWRGKTFIVQADGQVTEFAAVSPKATTSQNTSKSRVGLFGQLNSSQALQDEVLISSIDFADNQIKDCVSWSGAEYASQVRALNCGEVRVLSDLTHFKNLYFIQLYNFSASATGKFSFDDITPLAELPSLSSVRFDNYLLSDSDVLELTTKASKLGSLAINGAELTDSAISALMPAKDRLSSLSLENNQFSSISWLSAFSLLQDLDISGNDLSDQAIQTLNQLPETIYTLKIQDSNLSERPFTVPKQVRHLYLDNNGFTELAQISAAIDDVALLQGLSLSVNPIADLSGLAEFTALSRLFVQNNNVLQDFNFLEDLPALNDLYLNDSLVPEKFPAIKWSTNLSRITFFHGFQGVGQLRDISQLLESLKPLPAFSYIDLFGHNGIQCEQIEQLKQLQSEKGWSVQYPSACGVERIAIADIEFNDAKLKACAVNTGVQFSSELTWLSCGEVTDLTGLDQFPNLVGLQLYNNSEQTIAIQDHTPLTKLKNLRSFYYTNYSLSASALGFLKDMSPGLTYLSLWGNNLTDDVAAKIQPLKLQLRTLELSSNGITDIKWLHDFPVLETLDVGNNPLTDSSVANLHKLSNLTTLRLNSLNLAARSFTLPSGVQTLDLWNNGFTGVSQFANKIVDKAAVVTLNLGANPLADLSDLNIFQSLSSLYIAANTVATDFSFVNSLSKLENLDLSYTNIKGFQGLQLPSGLRSLSVNRNQTSAFWLEDISAFTSNLASYTSLRQVELYNQIHVPCEQINAIENAQSLSGFYFNGPTNCGVVPKHANTIENVKDPALFQCIQYRGAYLEDINFISSCYGNFTDLTALKFLTKLNSLSLYNSSAESAQVQGLDDVFTMPNLQYLTLSGFNLVDADIDVLSGNNSLAHLSLPQNKLTQASLPVFASMGALQALVLSNNAITSLEGIQTAAGLSYLDILNNPVADLKPVQIMQDLTSLSITVNSASILNGVKLSNKISSLHVEGSGLLSVSPVIAMLEEPSNLVGLSLMAPALKDLTGLSTLDGLTGFYLHNAKPTAGIAEVGNLSNLIQLGLFDTTVSLVNVASRIPYLQYVQLSGDNVTDISLLSNAVELQQLYIYEANVLSLKPLYSLPKLDYMFLYGYPVSCSEQTNFEAAQPSTYAYFDAYCLAADGKSFSVRNNNADITSVDFAREEDKALGTFEWTGSLFKFIPAKGVTGKQSIRVTVAFGQSSYTFSLTLFITAEGKAKMKRGIPTWVILGAGTQE